MGTRPPRTDACEECRGWPEILVRARSAAVLAEPADHLVHGLKYGGWRELGQVMGERMARVAPSAASASISRESKPGSGASGTRASKTGPGMSRVRSDSSVVVPVPTTRTRRRRRGYNQAAVLADAVGRALGRPVVHALERRAGAATQVALQPLERRRNVLRAFSLREDGARRIRGRHVLLVDDVLTTGATAGAASRALQGAGVAAVTLLTFARALPFRDG